MAYTEFRFSPRPNKAHLIAWRGWGSEAFGKARQDHKPILLSISAVWCHWCHVMDETTYSHAEVIKYINEHFIPVRVDSDQRPDVNSRYNMGGWPTTAFLDERGEVITGATYIPPERMLDVLPRVVEFYRNERRDAKTPQATPEEVLRAKSSKPVERKAAAKWEEMADFVYSLCVEHFDFELGGLGLQMKFPNTHLLRFLLNYHHLRGEARALGMLTNTLVQMHSRGLFDQVEGGFFRYSVSRDWSQPHFEKMLVDNCELAELYLDVWIVTKDKVFLDIALATLNYIEHNLTDFNLGGFYHSQDADEEYYHLNLAKRRQRLKPFVDPISYSGSSALAASVFLRAGLILNQPRYSLQAKKTIEALWRKAFDQGRGLNHVIAGQNRLYILSDQVEMLHCLIAATQTSGIRNYLAQAEILVEALMAQFSNAEARLQDVSKAGAEVGLLSRPENPLEENCRLVNGLFVLGKMTDTNHDKTIENILARLSSSYAEYGIAACELANALVVKVVPVMLANVILPASKQKIEEGLVQLASFFEPRLIVNPFVAGMDDELVRGKSYDTKEELTVYLCLGETCLPPFHSIASTIQELQNH